MHSHQRRFIARGRLFQPTRRRSLLALALAAVVGCAEASPAPVKAGLATNRPGMAQNSTAQPPEGTRGGPAEPAVQRAEPATDPGAATPAVDITEPPARLPASKRPTVEGQWRPTSLLSNDLVDPPKNYRQCTGGACFGMSSVMYALWCCPLTPGVMTVEDAASRVVYNLIPDARGQFENHPLPSQVLIDGRRTPTLSPPALVRLVEIVQNLVQPGGASPKTPGQIRRIYQIVQADPRRFLTVEEAKRRLESCGGRDVVGLATFNPDLTRIQGHAVVMTLGADGNLYVWDPNAKMEGDAAGSGKPALVQTRVDSSGRLRGVSYAITLPNGKPQTRFFTHVMPSSMFLSGVRLPAFPRRMLQEGLPQ